METIESLLKKSIGFLKEKGFDETRRTAELLLAHALQCNRIDLYLKFDRPLKDEELATYRELIRRRLQHEPTQYIIGTTEFYGVELEVSPATLIPRPDTETLVTVVLDVLKEHYADQSPKILDIGTGTGAIPIAVLSQWNKARFTGIDRSGDALALAKRNAERHGLEESLTLHMVDILAGTPVPLAPYPIVVSNPPYISKEEFATLEPEVNQHEPRYATCDDADGLTFYRTFAGRVNELLLPGGHLIVEIGFGQADDVRTLFENAGLDVRSTVRDLAGIERVVHGVKK